MKLLQRVHRLDVTTFHWCMHRKHRVVFTEVGKQISRSGDGLLYCVLPWILVALGWVTSDWLWLLAWAYGLERCLYWLLKNVLKRHRPEQALEGFAAFITPSDQFSFPSGHTSGAFLFACWLSFVLPAFAPLYFIWAALVGASRIFLGVHFLTDVAVGALLGSGCALLMKGSLNL